MNGKKIRVERIEPFNSEPLLPAEKRKHRGSKSKAGMITLDIEGLESMERICKLPDAMVLQTIA